MTKLRKLNLSGFIADEVQVKESQWKVYYLPVFLFNHDVFVSEEEQHFQYSDSTKKYDSQVGFLATVEKFHFYLGSSLLIQLKAANQ